MRRNGPGRGRLWVTAAATLLIAGLLGAGAASGGGGQFSDVQPGDPFFAEIEQFAHAGITAGFPDGTYRPSQPVTRGAMAAFLTRGLSTVDDNSANGVVQIGPSDGPTTVLELDYEVPGASGAGVTQFVWVTATVTWTTETTRAAACINEDSVPCSFTVQLINNGFEENFAINEARVSGDRDGGTVPLTFLFSSAPGTDHSLKIRVVPSAGIANDALHIRSRNMVVTSHPFIDQL